MTDAALTTDHPGPVLAERDGFSVIECAACGYAHVVPLPSALALAETYRHDYYRTDKPLYLDRYEEDRAWWEDVYADRLAILESDAPPGARTILDVGSGPGLFLDVARARGWHAAGVEPSEQAAAHARARGHQVNGGVFDAALAARLDPVAAVHMALVLEHVPDPAGLVAAAAGLLVENGLLCIVVPNDFNPLQQAATGLGLDPWWVAPPHHLNYFTRASLEVLMRRAGLTVMHSTATFPMELFLLMGERYVGDDALGRRCHGKRKAFETAMRAAGQGQRLARLYQALAGQDLGREIVMVARKAPA